MKENNNNVDEKQGYYLVELSSVIDYSRFFNMSSGAQMEELNKPYSNLKRTQSKSLKEASNMVKAFIEKNNLGSSNFTGGTILDENFNFCAHVSYNGRVWANKEGERPSREILL